MSKLNIELYKKMYLIRWAEQTIQVNYFDDEMKTPMHMSMGEEAIAVGICHALKQRRMEMARIERNDSKVPGEGSGCERACILNKRIRLRMSEGHG